MAKIESTIKSEIQRLARHEVRVSFSPSSQGIRGDKAQTIKPAEVVCANETLGEGNIGEQE